MWNWNYLLLMLIKVSDIETGCKWEDNSSTSQKYCSITCNSKSAISQESVTKIMPILNVEWDKVKKIFFSNSLEIITRFSLTVASELPRRWYRLETGKFEILRQHSDKEFFYSPSESETIIVDAEEHSWPTIVGKDRN